MNHIFMIVCKKSGQKRFKEINIDTFMSKTGKSC